ncbi:MAG: Bax inhibitor-1/YccA family protein [Phycisphaerales bacterium]
MFRSSNPALREDYFQPAEGLSALGRPEGEVKAKPTTMTVSGVVNKTYILLLLCVAAAVFAWSFVVPGNSTGALGPAQAKLAYMLMGVGAIGGLVLALVTIFKPKAAPVTAPLYALFEGVFVGAISAIYAVSFGNETVGGGFQLNVGMVLNAVLLTFGMLGAMLFLYRTGVIKVTDRFAAIIGSAVGAIMLVYVVGLVMSLFGSGIPLIHGSGPIGIGFSLVVIGIAGLSLTLDFEMVARGVEAGAPKHMEWYAGFSLLVTLVWLYLEILRLLAKLQSRD